MKKRFDILLNICFPLAAGLFIYWLPSFVHIPALVKNYVPDGLWAYAFISSTLIVWDREINLIWTITVFVTALCFEWLQYIHVIPGTGDIEDVLVYFLCFAIALIINPFFKSSVK